MGINNDDNEPTVLKVTYDRQSKVVRHLLLSRLHLRVQLDSNGPENCTLLVGNVPPFANEAHIRHLFEGRCGQIRRIVFCDSLKPSLAMITSVFDKMVHADEDKTRAKQVQQLTEEIADKYLKSSSNSFSGYRACYVIFAASSGLQKAFDMCERSDGEQFVLKPDDPNVEDEQAEPFYTGVRLWQKQYNEKRYPPHVARKEIEAFLQVYRAQQAEVLETEKRLAEAGPDKDGWVTVNRKLKRDRKALLANRDIDKDIKAKYQQRELKRRHDESQFDVSIEKSLNEMKADLKAAKKKTKTNFIKNIDAMEF